MRDQRDTDRRIALIAARQEGVIDHAQLRALGLSPPAIGRRLAAGSLHPRYRGVYAVGHPVLSAAGERWAAVRACGEGAVLSHATAGDASGLRRSSSPTIHVTVREFSGRRSRPLLRIHRRALPDDEVTTLAGLPTVPSGNCASTGPTCTGSSNATVGVRECPPSMRCCGSPTTNA